MEFPRVGDKIWPFVMRQNLAILFLKIWGKNQHFRLT
jgi:hypothetical protein